MNEEDAARRLAAAPYDPPGDARPCFRLWHFPPEGSWRSWTLFLRDRRPALIRELGWDRLQRFWTSDVSLDGDRVEALLRRAGGLPLDAASPDVERTEFGIEGHSRSARPLRIGWNAPVPPEYETLAAWYSRARSLFEERLDGGPA